MTRRQVVLALLLWAATASVFVQAAELSFDLHLQDGRVPENMRLIRVSEGDVVTLRWTSDRPLLLHLHGYDIEWRVQPGSVASSAFTARLSGRFPVHAHATSGNANDHAHQDSPLVYLEVYPH